MIDTRQTNNRQALEWYTCSRCGFNYPRTSVSVQNGLVLCEGQNTMNCQDQPGRIALYREPLPHEQPVPPLPQKTEIL